MLPTKKKCCGCGVCANVCDLSACSMVSDYEGFLYPKIDKDKCVGCGKCEKSCPVLSGKNYFTIKVENKSYCGHYTNEVKVKESASGGAASSLAEAIILSGGVVYGVAYSEDFRYAHHIRCSTVDEIKFLRGSKYNQSRKEFIYCSIEEDLKKGMCVLFIGTPCEVVAVKAFLKKEYKNLLTCDLICEGTTSEIVLKDFIFSLESKFKSRVVDFSARYKKYEWAPAYIYAKFDNGKEYCKLAHYTDYGEAHNVFLRPSCYECEFKGTNRASDITLGDCWGIPRNSELWNKYGVSVLLVHTERGMRLINEFKQCQLKEYPYDEKKNPRLITSASLDSSRRVFEINIKDKGLKESCRLARSTSKTLKRVLYGLTPDYLIQKIKEVRG